MNEILNFLIKHWQLSGLLILIASAYLIYEFMQANSSEAITPEQAVAMINHQDGVVVDVRTIEEFNNGHILHAINLESNDPDIKLNKLNKYIHKPIIVVCAQGKRSAQYLKRLQAQGFKQAFTLAGGLNAWQDAGLPLTSK